MRMSCIDSHASTAFFSLVDLFVSVVTRESEKKIPIMIDAYKIQVLCENKKKHHTKRSPERK